MITFAEGNEPYKVEISALLVGDDLVVIVRGGEAPHVSRGGQYLRPTWLMPKKSVLQPQFLLWSGIKRTSWPRQWPENCCNPEKKCCLTTGIHVDNISGEGIKNSGKQLPQSFGKIIDALYSLSY